MKPSGLIFRIILALIFPPLGVIGLDGMGCGTFLLLLLLTILFYVPGQIASIFLIVQEYIKSNPTKQL